MLYLEKMLSQINKKTILGIILLLASLPPYVITFAVFLLVGLGGWTCDSCALQSIQEQIYARVYAILYFTSNVLLSLSGIFLILNKSKKIVFIVFLFGIFSAFIFYGQIIFSLFFLPRK